MAETSNLVKVGKAILSAECIHELASMQEDNNSGIDYEVGQIKDTIILLIRSDFQGNENLQQKRSEIIVFLSDFIDSYSRLKA